MMLQVGRLSYWIEGRSPAKENCKPQGEGQVESERQVWKGGTAQRGKGRGRISHSDYGLLGASALWKPFRDGRKGCSWHVSWHSEYIRTTNHVSRSAQVGS